MEKMDNRGKCPVLETQFHLIVPQTCVLCPCSYTLSSQFLFFSLTLFFDDPSAGMTSRALMSRGSRTWGIKKQVWGIVYLCTQFTCCKGVKVWRPSEIILRIQEVRIVIIVVCKMLSFPTLIVHTFFYLKCGEKALDYFSVVHHCSHCKQKSDCSDLLQRLKARIVFPVNFFSQSKTRQPFFVVISHFTDSSEVSIWL